MKVRKLLLLFAAIFGLFAGTPAGKHDDLTALARAALSQTSGVIKIKGLQKPVRVLRDEWGIAHIYAETQSDLFFAQGFVAAQDRLWQMDIWRRIGEGKLAEILGPRAIERDRFARLIKYRGDMKAEYESYAPDAKEIIEAFVSGVNALIETSRDRLPIEFQLTGLKPEPWTPDVCLTRMAGYVMTRNATNEVLRAQLTSELGKDFVDRWIETDPQRKLEIPEGLNLDGIEPKILSAAAAAGGPVVFNPNDGSNNWVIDGTMSSTGKPLLANDPHRQIALPSLRYLVHLVGPGWNVIGAGEPALPGVAAGHNDRVGFGFTIVGIDQQDLYVEELNSANPNEYKWQGGWRKMQIEREQLKVKGETRPREIELKFSHHGPIIYEDAARKRAYALRWVGSEPGSAGYLASLSLNRARNWEEFVKALERWKVPSENLIYADVDGNIGWVAAGMTPIRRNWSGLLPVPGADGKYEWDGFLPLSELPQSYNPAKHFIATANHNIIPAGYKKELGYEWANPLRFRRIEEVLKRPQAKFSVADFEKLQHDDLSIMARELTGLLKSVKVPIPQNQKRLVELLTQWDHRLSQDSAAALLYEHWLPRLNAAVFKSQVPERVWSTISTRITPIKTIQTLKNSPNRRDAILLKSLEEAATDVSSKFGSDPAKWRWGNVHVAQFTHQLSNNKNWSKLLDLSEVQRSGDANTVFSTSGPNMRQNHGASFREILDVSDWDRSVATNVPGQSGQPMSKHYGDLLPLWADGKYFPLLFSKSKVESMAKESLMLEPKN